MQKISFDDLDATLRDEVVCDGDTEGWQAFRTTYSEATVDNQEYHLVFSHRWQRGGIILVGSGSSGLTGWTDAGSPEEILERFVTDRMTA